MAKRTGKFFLKILLSMVIICMAGGAYLLIHYYNIILKPNVVVKENQEVIFYIPTGSKISDVTDKLINEGIIIKRSSFVWVAEYMKYSANVKPGKYLIKSGINNKELVTLLRSGSQVPVKLTFNNLRLREELAGAVSQQIEADSVTVINFLNSDSIAEKYGFTHDAFFSMFIPNTYEFKWNTSAPEFIQRMATEYKTYWNPQRLQKAKELGLSQSETSALAAIVQKETAKNDEKPRVAGVYYNRIKLGMPLQADPTLIFALGDFTIKRVLNVHKEIESPYNTYKYKGLPPGPICLPEISSIEAVLNLEKHKFLYFCAKDDFSGYHNFAASYSQHLVNARKWQKALNDKKVYK